MLIIFIFHLFIICVLYCGVGCYKHSCSNLFTCFIIVLGIKEVNVTELNHSFSINVNKQMILNYHNHLFITIFKAAIHEVVKFER